MKNLDGTENTYNNYYPVTASFEISFDKGAFSIKYAKGQKQNFLDCSDTGAFFSADTRGSEAGTVRAIMNEAFDILQNGGYITGSTYEIKEIIKTLNFKWNKYKKRWEK